MVHVIVLRIVSVGNDRCVPVARRVSVRHCDSDGRTNQAGGVESLPRFAHCNIYKPICCVPTWPIDANSCSDWDVDDAGPNFGNRYTLCISISRSISGFSIR